MHPIMENYRDNIETYCAMNGLSAEKTFASAQSGNPERVTLYRRPVFSGAKTILVDNTPMPIVLQIYLEDGKLRFEQTDITHKYLGVEKDVAPTPKVTRTVRSSIPSRQKLAYA